MNARLDARLAKIETTRRAKRQDRFFIVWGRDDADAVKRVRAAYARGDFRDGDPVMFASWHPSPEPMPGSRWTTVKEISDAELRALIASVDDDRQSALGGARTVSGISDNELMGVIAESFRLGVSVIVREAQR